MKFFTSKPVSRFFLLLSISNVSFSYPSASPSRLSERVAARRSRNRQTNPAIYLASPSFSSNKILTSEATEASNADHNSTLSSNWAGAVLISAPQGQSYTTAVGTFIIPDPKASGQGSGQSASASAWVGIDGDTANAAILQAGVDFTVGTDGSVSYDAWNEFFPTPAEDFTGFPMAAGDSITVTIKATSATSGAVTLENNTQQRSVSKTLTSPSSTATLAGQNAEWIVEDFVVNGQFVNLVNFGQVPFTDCSATTNKGQSIGLDDANAINIQGSNGNVLTKVAFEGPSAVTVSHV